MRPDLVLLPVTLQAETRCYNLVAILNWWIIISCHPTTINIHHGAGHIRSLGAQ